MEGDAAVGVGAGGAVLEVALDGAADGRQLRPDLMFASGDQVHLEQPIALAGGDDAVMEHCLLVKSFFAVLRQLKISLCQSPVLFSKTLKYLKTVEFK